MSPEMLLQSIHRVVEGGRQMDTAVLRTAVENLIQNSRKTLVERTTEAAHLIEREVDVLRLMGNGDSNKVIAATLGITLDTVKKHVRNVIDKLQVHISTHAAIIAAQAGIVGNPVSPVVEARSELGLRVSHKLIHSNKIDWFIAEQYSSQCNILETLEPA